jgi:DNA polymerase epsilon subunit 3
MPPKKAGTAGTNADSQPQDIGEGIDNFELPKSLVTKIAKSAVRNASLNGSKTI